MNLQPWELGRLQPHEFLQKWDGYRWRQEQQKIGRENQENMMAYFVHNIMAGLVKSPPSPQQLLKPFRPEAERNKKDDEQYLREKFKGKLPGGV